MTYRSSSPCPLPLTWLALAALVTLALPACKPKAIPAADRTEILIGGTLPLTGGEARIGNFFKEGYDLAFEEVTRAGGL